MAYQVYTTEALVCASRDNNTSDRSFLLFTKDAGMLWASAKSVREERSKHRYALQNFGVIRVSLVRGKSGWRVTGSESLKNLYFNAASRQSRTLVRNVVRLLCRFVHGETALPHIYADVVSIPEFEEEAMKVLERVITLRALYHLGYIALAEPLVPLVHAANLTDAYNEAPSDLLIQSESLIADALTASHL